MNPQVRVPDLDWKRSGLRLVPTLIILTGFSIWKPFFWAELFRPLYLATTSPLLPTGATQEIVMRFDRLEPVIALHLRFEAPFETAAGQLSPDMQAVLITSAGHAAEPVIIFYTLLLAWVPLTRRQRVLGLTASVPAIFTLQAITVPFLLAGNFYTKICAESCSNKVQLLLWRAWLNLLENGGDWALTVVMAIACLFMAHKLSPKK